MKQENTGFKKIDPNGPDKNSIESVINGIPVNTIINGVGKEYREKLKQKKGK